MLIMLDSGGGRSRSDEAGGKGVSATEKGGGAAPEGTSFNAAQPEEPVVS